MLPLHAHYPSLPLRVIICHFFRFHDVLEGNDIDCAESLGNFRGYDPSLDPYTLYLGNLPAEIMYTIAFDHFYDFSKAFD